MAPPNTGNLGAYPVTGSTLTPNGTNVSLSTFIVIKVGANIVGAVSELQIQESRDIAPVVEIGTDGVIDSAPNKAAKVSGSCKRTRFDRLRIAEGFSRGFLHVKAQRVPFDIEIIDKIIGDTEEQHIVTVLSGVWITQISYTYSADNYIITDSMNWTAEDIYTKLNDGSAAVGGSRFLQPEYDVYEVAADKGQRRGAIDSPDLLNVPLSSL
jgi:hypothetical protein